MVKLIFLYVYVYILRSFNSKSLHIAFSKVHYAFLYSSTLTSHLPSHWTLSILLYPVLFNTSNIVALWVCVCGGGCIDVRQLTKIRSFFLPCGSQDLIQGSGLGASLFHTKSSQPEIFWDLDTLFFWYKIISGAGILWTVFQSWLSIF